MREPGFLDASPHTISIFKFFKKFLSFSGFLLCCGKTLPPTTARSSMPKRVAGFPQAGQNNNQHSNGKRRRRIDDGDGDGDDDDDDGDGDASGGGWNQAAGNKRVGCMFGSSKVGKHQRKGRNLSGIGRLGGHGSWTGNGGAHLVVGLEERGGRGDEPQDGFPARPRSTVASKRNNQEQTKVVGQLGGMESQPLRRSLRLMPG